MIKSKIRIVLLILSQLSAMQGVVHSHISPVVEKLKNLGSTRRSEFIKRPIEVANNSHETLTINRKLASGVNATKYASPDDKMEVFKRVMEAEFIHYNKDPNVNPLCYNNDATLYLGKDKVQLAIKNHFTILKDVKNFSHALVDLYKKDPTQNIYNLVNNKWSTENKLGTKIEDLSGITVNQFATWFNAVITGHTPNLKMGAHEVLTNPAVRALAKNEGYHIRFGNVERFFSDGYCKAVFVAQYNGAAMLPSILIKLPDQGAKQKFIVIQQITNISDGPYLRQFGIRWLNLMHGFFDFRL